LRRGLDRRRGRRRRGRRRRPLVLRQTLQHLGDAPVHLLLVGGERIAIEVDAVPCQRLAAVAQLPGGLRAVVRERRRGEEPVGGLEIADRRLVVLLLVVVDAGLGEGLGPFLVVVGPRMRRGEKEGGGEGGADEFFHFFPNGSMRSSSPF